MTIDYNTIIGFLGGSLVTLIVREIINQINKKQDFVRELKKVTYIRKLEKAEKAIAYYWTYLSRVVELKKSFQVIIQAVNELEEKDNDIQIILGILEQNSKALTDLAGDKYLDINSIHLYFDLEDTEKWSEQDVEFFLKALAETKSIDNDIQFWISLHNSHHDKNETQKADFCWKKAVELLPNYVSSLQRVVEILERNKVASYSMMKKIKDQLKIY
jgi:tetratricopeptide (TPR) repeat protein